MRPGNDFLSAARTGVRPSENNRTQYNNLLQCLPVAAYMTDIHGYITEYNKLATVLWGAEPVVGVDRWYPANTAVADEASRIAGTSAVAVALNCGNAIPQEQWAISGADGSKRMVKPQASPIMEQGILKGAICMVTEIKETEQQTQRDKQKQDIAAELERLVEERIHALTEKNEALRTSEERYHKMIEEVEDYAILLMDKDGFIQNWNKGAEKIKGYKESEIVGKNFRLFYREEDQKNKLPERLIEEAMRTGKANHEGWRVRKNGSTFWGSIVITSLHDANNNIIGFSKVTRDLTERKKAENQLREYATELEFQNRELQQFTYAAAHDMKEPLRKVQFYNSTVLDNSGALLPEKERSYLKRSVDAALRMQSLIDDMLTYASTSKTAEALVPVDLDQVVTEVCRPYLDSEDHKDLTIAFSNLPVVWGVHFQLIQLFDNILSNAIKYRHQERRPHIEIHGEVCDGADYGLNAEGQNKFYKVTVSDNGIGFAPEYEERIFDIFMRLHTKSEYPGTGIGLAICKKIIVHHKGAIIAKGQPGRGAEFLLFFPVEKPVY